MRKGAADVDRRRASWDADSGICGLPHALPPEERRGHVPHISYNWLMEKSASKRKKRVHDVHIYFTEQEYGDICREADRLGLTATVFVRSKAVMAARRAMAKADGA